jgi:hypothetical protein
MIRDLLLDNYKVVNKWLISLEWDDKPLNIDEYTLNCVEQYGGEDCGSNYWIVFSIEKDGEKKVYRCDGSYYSYDGVEMDANDSYEVEPQEKTIIEWVRK